MTGAASGVRVLDFTWYGVGPVTTKYLADNGAEVVKIESMARPDGTRLNAPWKDATPGINRSQFYGSLNSSKKSITLNMGTEQGRDLARRLVPKFDVVADSFTAGTMVEWGFGYADLCALKPDIIQLSTCMQGQTGPYAKYPGFGNLMAALSGFYYVSGYSEDEIGPPYGAYTDFIVPRYACFALLAAIDHHRRTGEGQFIDVSQYEAALHNLAPAITDYFATGTVLGPQGNRSMRYSPHGSYRCRDESGDERWIALAVENDAEWKALLSALGADPGSDAFGTQLERLQRPAEVDAFVQEFVRERAAAEVVAALQERGVSAYPVQNCLDLRSDDNLLGFDFWPWLDQTECGPMPYDGLAYRFERTPGVQTAAPNIGEHTEEILGDLLGLSSREIEQLTEDRIVY
jgi:benzylsuccinate CoA-transferase BbsF subunit